MTKSELATVVTAVAVAASGAAFGAFLAVSQIEAVIDKYFGGKPTERDQTVRIIENPDAITFEEARHRYGDGIWGGAPWPT
ncbi:hypothetical protein CH300_00215 [Rhodococcus sp. 15-1154-1]|nr:hypothetical protein [Rhodococcus sp. 15-1154-1]OZF09840.1 hypothetical protein CH300_00215 [Rhodococcus sp. 15-1154-1]